MTQNQLMYQNNKETERHNAAVEKETQRHNQFNNVLGAIGAATQIAGAITAAVTGGANVIGTIGGLAVNAARAAETVRHNQAVEAETTRANQTQEQLKADQIEKQYTIGLGQLDAQRWFNEQTVRWRDDSLALTKWYQEQQIDLGQQKLDLSREQFDFQKDTTERQLGQGDRKLDQGDRSLDQSEQRLGLDEQVTAAKVKDVDERWNPFWRGADFLVRSGLMKGILEGD